MFARDYPTAGVRASFSCSSCWSTSAPVTSPSSAGRGPALPACRYLNTIKYNAFSCFGWPNSYGLISALNCLSKTNILEIRVIKSQYMNKKLILSVPFTDNVIFGHFLAWEQLFCFILTNLFAICILGMFHQTKAALRAGASLQMRGGRRV